MAEVRPSGRYSARDRVRKRAEFLRIQQGGRRVVSPGFVFMLDRSASGHGPRLGITASRRVGNAVQRNRAKRLVREAFRAVRSTWPAIDVVVIVREGLGNRTLADVLGEWQAARGRILRRCAELTEQPASTTEGPRQQSSRAPVAGVEDSAAQRYAADGHAAQGRDAKPLHRVRGE